MAKLKLRWPALSAGTLAGLGLGVTMMASIYSGGQVPAGDPFHPAGGAGSATATTSASTPADTSPALPVTAPESRDTRPVSTNAAPTGPAAAVVTTAAPAPAAPAPATPGAAAVTPAATTTPAAPSTSTYPMPPLPTASAAATIPWCYDAGGHRWYSGEGQGCTPKNPDFREYR